ncbi:hypothetical protein MKZ38_005510 [Zalerion maritima]|uniref:Mitotic checkpoint protein BUB3 n=1 Tax=Zalerion maritima TaxID=339359 RepID=A0AAD5RW41_9PEZI|nr:hypothetical protein MKZ38_005510 [Zalerion maritima]
MAPSQIEIAQPPADAISAIAFAPSTPTRFLVSSWSKSVYLYDMSGGEEGGEGCLLGEFEHPAPVLSVCFGDDDNEAYTGLDLSSGELTVLTKHAGAPASKVAYSREHSLLISTSWDMTMHILPTSNSSSPLIVTLPAKPFALSLSPSKVVVAMAARLLHIYSLPSLVAGIQAGNPVEPWQMRESSLKFMTRSVSCMPSDLGYATSSVEGRVAVEWFDSSAESQARKYAFKCHRTLHAEKNEEDGKEETVDLVYPVNALAFHPVHGTFASGGGDGTVALWDAAAKRRMKQYQKFPDSVHCLAFSCDGKYLAVGIGPGFEDATINHYDAKGKARILVRELGENEAKGKSSK